MIILKYLDLIFYKKMKHNKHVSFFAVSHKYFIVSFVSTHIIVYLGYSQSIMSYHNIQIFHVICKTILMHDIIDCFFILHIILWQDMISPICTCDKRETENKRFYALYKFIVVYDGTNALAY